MEFATHRRDGRRAVRRVVRCPAALRAGPRRRTRVRAGTPMSGAHARSTRRRRGTSVSTPTARHSRHPVAVGALEVTRDDNLAVHRGEPLRRSRRTAPRLRFGTARRTRTVRSRTGPSDAAHLRHRRLARDRLRAEPRVRRAPRLPRRRGERPSRPRVAPTRRRTRSPLGRVESASRRDYEILSWTNAHARGPRRRRERTSRRSCPPRRRTSTSTSRPNTGTPRGFACTRRRRTQMGRDLLVAAARHRGYRRARRLQRTHRVARPAPDGLPVGHARRATPPGPPTGRTVEGDDHAPARGRRLRDHEDHDVQLQVERTDDRGQRGARSARSPAPWWRGARTSRARSPSGPRRSSRAPRRSPCDTDRSN